MLVAFEFWGLVRMTRRRGNSGMTWSSNQTCYAAIRPLFYLKAPSAIALQADSNQYLPTCIKAKAPSPSRMNTCEKRGAAACSTNIESAAPPRRLCRVSISQEYSSKSRTQRMVPSPQILATLALTHPTAHVPLLPITKKFTNIGCRSAAARSMMEFLDNGSFRLALTKQPNKKRIPAGGTRRAHSIETERN